MGSGFSDDIYVANQSFTTTVDGVPVNVTGGVTRVRKGHKLLKGRESLFTPLDIHYDVERATAAPGEKREAAPAAPASASEAPAEAPVEAPAAVDKKSAPTKGLTTASLGGSK